LVVLLALFVAAQSAQNGAGMAMGAAGVGNQWQQPASMAMNGATAYGGGANDAGSPCANAVLAIVRSCNSDAGMHTHEVRSVAWWHGSFCLLCECCCSAEWCCWIMV